MNFSCVELNTKRADVRTTSRSVDALILKLVPDNTSRPPFACFALPLCTDAQMAAASSSLCSQMTLTHELNWPLFLRGCSPDTTRVCGRDNGERCRLQKPPPPIIAAPSPCACVRACVRDRLPPNYTAARVKRSGFRLKPPSAIFLAD